MLPGVDSEYEMFGAVHQVYCCNHSWRSRMAGFVGEESNRFVSRSLHILYSDQLCVQGLVSPCGARVGRGCRVEVLVRVRTVR